MAILGHDRGVDLPERALEIMSLLSTRNMPDSIPVEKVVAVLNRAQIKFVLVGAYGIARWKREGRATYDVDVIVSSRQVKKAVSALLGAFPELEPVDSPVVTRLCRRGTGDILIDVIKPVEQQQKEALKHTVKTQVGKEVCAIPSVEMALVLKFASMISPNRETADKHRDAADFIRVVEHDPDADGDETAEASLIYPDAGKDILQMIKDARAGKTLRL